MPITLLGNTKAILPNEMTGKDFDSVKCNWFYSNFTSHGFCLEVDNSKPMKLAAFLNESACGPYYIHQSTERYPARVFKAEYQEQLANGGTVAEFRVILFHPDDRAKFAREFDAELWKQDLAAVEKNADVLAFQLKNNFQYEIFAMADLLKELKAIHPTGEFKGADVDAVARRLWVAPHRPALDATEASRLML